jgi:hypothetical protein
MKLSIIYILNKHSTDYGDGNSIHLEGRSKNVYFVLYYCRIHISMGNFGFTLTSRLCVWNAWWNLGINDPVTAQYAGFGLHLLTGTVAGNIYGQAAIFWRKLAPNSYRHGIKSGLIVGIALWAILFVPLTTFGIQPKLDSFVTSAPNQYIFEITSHFQGLYPVIIIGSLVFHLIYGAFLGFLAGRMTEVRAFVNQKIGS